MPLFSTAGINPNDKRRGPIRSRLLFLNMIECVLHALVNAAGLAMFEVEGTDIVGSVSEGNG